MKPNKDKFNPLNYRGISLLSCVGKLYSALLTSRITKYCEHDNLIADEQNGFRPGRSCTDHIYVLTSLIRNRLALNIDTFCAFIDMEKAFDWLNRMLLLYRLIESKIDGNIYFAIKALFDHNSAFVQLQDGLSTDWFDVPSGVRQGDPLSASLFSIYINSLIDYVNELNLAVDIDGKQICILLYADDIVLIGKSEAELQSLLLSLETWCKQWQLHVNLEKSKVVHFRNPRKNRTEFLFKLNENDMEKVAVYKYLGLHIDEFLNLNTNSEHIANFGLSSTRWGY